jgi:hypothetical protein
MRYLFRFFKLSFGVTLIDPLGVRPYLGPETLMPLASILAAIAGFFLMFWRTILKFIKKTVRKMRGLPDEVPPDVDIEESLEEEKDL